MSLAYLDEQRVSFGDSLHVGCQHVMREQLHVFNQHAVEFISSQVCTGSNCLSSSYYSRRTVYMWTGSVCVTLPKGSPKLWERYYGSGRTGVQFNLAHLMHSFSGNSQLNKWIHYNNFFFGEIEKNNQSEDEDSDRLQAILLK